MKATILKTMAIFTLCLFSMNSYSQSKEETISWLNEKLDKYLIGRQADTKMLEININECEIILNFIESGHNLYEYRFFAHCLILILI